MFIAFCLAVNLGLLDLHCAPLQQYRATVKDVEPFLSTDTMGVAKF